METSGEQQQEQAQEPIGVHDTPESQDNQTPPSPQQPTPQQTQQPSFSPEMIANAVTQGVQKALPQQQPQMSQEEINKALKVWNPDEKFAGDFVKALQPDADGRISAAGVAQALGQLVNNIRQESQTYATAYARQQAQEIQNSFNPVIAAHQAQQRQQRISQFTSAYPALKPYESLIPVAAQTLAASGVNFSTDAQLFPALAAQVEAQIKTFNPQFSVGSPAPTNSGTGGNVTPASVATSQGGGGSRTTTPTQSGQAANLWGGQ